jgi:methylated-DNA-[protein]-cysteine S-methyltransferase
MKKGFFYQTTLGTFYIAEEYAAITDMRLVIATIENEDEIVETLLIREAFIQLQEYLNGRRQLFTLPLRPQGTAFQNEVWQVLKMIPYGETRSYGQIAAMISNPHASQAVAMANNKNPILFYIPSHRLTAANGRLNESTGGAAMKKYLLELEQLHKNK